MRLILSFMLLLFLSCERDGTPANGAEKSIDPYSLPSTDGDALNVVIEIPAGSNHKIEYRPGTGYVNDTLADGTERVVAFLPYPGNYGFVPSTMMDRARGGDGDALDVLVIGESRPTGTLIRALPIGALMLRDRGEIDTKIIAIPADPAHQTLAVANFLEFSLGNDAAKRIIEAWFLNYKGPGMVELLRWEDEAFAWREVRKWQTDNNLLKKE